MALINEAVIVSEIEDKQISGVFNSTSIFYTVPEGRKFVGLVGNDSSARTVSVFGATIEIVTNTIPNIVGLAGSSLSGYAPQVYYLGVESNA
jgi:hypothetical protein